MSIATNPAASPAEAPVVTPTMPHAAAILGHALQFKRAPLEFLRSVRPHGDVVVIKLGAKPAYVVNHHDLIRRILVHDVSKFDKGLQAQKARPVFGNGLIISDGAFHLRQRRLMQPAFHRDRIARHIAVMAEYAAARTGSWQPGRQLAMDQELRSLAVAIVTKALFSTEVGTASVAEVESAFPVILDGFIKRVFSPIPFYDKLPTRSNRRMNAALTRLRAVIDGIIRQYRDGALDSGDLLSMLLLSRYEDTGLGLPDQQVHDEVLTIIFAGAESSANAMSWACHLLAEHPEEQHRLQAEVDSVLGDAPPGMADVGRLEHTRRVLTETLRMYPPPFMLSRRATADLDLGGHRIPKGSMVLFSPYALHRDPTIYPEPDRFDPDRWLPERAKAIPRAAYIPFVAGNHACIGESFAWTEMAVTLSAIAQRWTMHSVPGHPVRPSVTGTIVPDQLPMTVQPRSGHAGPTPRNSP